MLSKILKKLSQILSYIMCIVVTYNYRDMICGIKHQGFSAPAYISFILGIPFLIVIIILLIIAKILEKKKSL